MTVRVRVDFGTGLDIEYPSQAAAETGIRAFADAGLKAYVATGMRPLPRDDHQPLSYAMPPKRGRQTKVEAE